jgi:Fe2+ or Zn2+ uptake regulation protein
MKEREEKAKSMERALRATGSRVSSHRRAIIDYLASATSHPSARQIFREVREKHSGLSLATVYNTLGVLARIGVIKVMQFDVKDNRYEPNVASHINLICTACGRIEDLEPEILVKPEEIKEKIGFEVFDTRLEYHGFCAECRARSQGKRSVGNGPQQ